MSTSCNLDAEPWRQAGSGSRDRREGGAGVFQAIIFDLFGTLVNMYPFHAPRSIHEIARILDVAADDFAGPWLASYPAREEGKYPAVTDCISSIGQQLGRDFSPSQLEQAEAALIRQAREAITPRPGCLNALRTFRDRGYRIGLISGCSPEVPSIWKDTALASVIDAAVFTCVAGARKPDPRVYQQACQRLAVQPSECLYVGDGTSGELTGALRVGMHPVLMRVPYDREYDFLRDEAAAWEGTRVSRLSGILQFLDQQKRKPQVSFYRIGAVPAERLRVAVVAARWRGKWVLVRPRGCARWGMPGGPCAATETTDQAAVRGLIGQTGAAPSLLSPVADWAITFRGGQTCGRLYLAELSPAVAFTGTEHGEMRLVGRLPADLEQPDITPQLLRRVLRSGLI